MKYSAFLEENYNILLKMLNCMKIGIWITDGKGCVVMVNDQSVKRGGLKREEVIGRQMGELIEMGYIIRESSVLKALETGREESIVQQMGEGGTLVATSAPLFYKGEPDLVICIERNVSDIANLEVVLTKQKDLTAKLKSELASFRTKNINGYDEMVASDVQSVSLKERAINIGAIDATVMITGESGTGKEVIANTIHKNSRRAEAPFVKINCAAIPENLLESEMFGYEKGAFTGADRDGKIGLFELANGGTMFLDEIGDLPITMQSKLLRVLQDKEIRRVGGVASIPIDVRIIVATNKNLKEEIEKGNFRNDLFYRLYVVPIDVPPLRKRREDIVQLTYHFLDEFNDQYGFNKTISDDAVRIMEEYQWPGNVRELRNVVERLVVSAVGGEISAFQVQMCIKGVNDVIGIGARVDMDDCSLEKMVSEYEKQIIVQALDECCNASDAAKLLKVNKSTISKKRKKYGI